MARTKKFTVDNVSPVAVRAIEYCQKVLLFENKWAATLNYTFTGVGASDDADEYAAGIPCPLEAPSGSWFTPGQLLGYVQAATVGSMSMCQKEQ